MRSALCTSRSRKPSASIRSPTRSCQRATVSCEVQWSNAFCSYRSYLSGSHTLSITPRKTTPACEMEFEGKPMRMHPSRHAAEILNAVSNHGSEELQQRLVRAAADCRSTAGLTSLERELFEALEACVHALQSGAASLERRQAAAEILGHLVAMGQAEKPRSSPIRENRRSATTVSSHR